MSSLISRGLAQAGIRALPWPDALPFYEAVIAGPRADGITVATADATAARPGEPSRIIDATAYIFVPVFVGAAFYWLILPDLTWAILYAWLCGSMLAYLILALDPRRRQATNRRSMDHYLPLFEKLHRGATPSARDLFGADVLVASVGIGPFAWLAYRKMPTLAVGVLLVPVAIRAALTAAGVSADSVNGFQFETFLALALALAHGPLYFWQATRLADVCLASSGKSALQQLRKHGGTNRWLWMVLFLLSWSIAFVPLQIDLWRARTDRGEAAGQAQSRINTP